MGRFSKKPHIRRARREAAPVVLTVQEPTHCPCLPSNHPDRHKISPAPAWHTLRCPACSGPMEPLRSMRRYAFCLGKCRGLYWSDPSPEAQLKPAVNGHLTPVSEQGQEMLRRLLVLR